MHRDGIAYGLFCRSWSLHYLLQALEYEPYAKIQDRCKS